MPSQLADDDLSVGRGPDTQRRLMANADLLRDVQHRKHQRLGVRFPLTYIVDGDPVPKDGQAVDIGGRRDALQKHESR